jgi:hypothetical protein
MARQIFGTYPPHRASIGQSLWQFLLLVFLSLLVVVGLALLSRAELRLSGETFAADEGDLQRMFLFGRPEVELVQETEDVKLYLVTSQGRQYLVEFGREEEEGWVFREMEKVRS